MNKPAPHSQAIAVKAIITNDDGEVLVLQQNDPSCSGDGMYHPPGGMLEMAESLKECLVREVEEELSVTATAGELIAVEEWEATIQGKHIHFIGIFYHCSVDSYEFTLQDNEVSTAAWANKDNIDSLEILEPSKSVIKNVLSQAK